MARKKKKKKSGLQSFFSKKKKKKRSKRKDSTSVVTGLKITLSIMFLAVLIGGGAVGLIYMDRFVKDAAMKEMPEGTVVFSRPPIWLNQEWKDWIEDILGGATFPLNDQSAQTIYQKLNNVAWFKSIRVQTKPNCIAVEAEYRRPAGLIGSGNRKVYVADDMAIMNYIPTKAVPVIEIKGVNSNVPEPGQIWLAEDAGAAVKLLDLLYTIDRLYQQEREKKAGNQAGALESNIPSKPLLDEIESIDVSNYAARKSRSSDKPHIVLNVKDGSKVYWGAALGQANVYFEADEKIKRARLYQFFVDNNNTLQGAAKYIDLRWLEDGIPRPH